MVAIVALLIAVLIGLLITRFATIALVSTGMSKQYARFQARSAFTGVGFTTNEAERVVNHPVRRRVILTLMLLGNAGIATVVATLLLGFSDSGGSEMAARGLVLVLGLAGIWLLAASPWVDRRVRRIFASFVSDDDDAHVRDYAGLLKVGADYDIGELHIDDGHWLAGRTLGQTSLRNEGAVVLGIDRNGDYYGAPDARFTLEAGDTLTLYGHQSTLHDLDRRRSGPSGELAHVDRVAEHVTRQRDEQPGRNEQPD